MIRQKFILAVPGVSSSDHSSAQCLPLLNKNEHRTSSVHPVSHTSVSASETYNKNHIYAEKKRRQNIKQGFDSLRTLINGANPGGHKVLPWSTLVSKIFFLNYRSQFWSRK